MKKILFIFTIIFSLRCLAGVTIADGGGGWERSMDKDFSSIRSILKDINVAEGDGFNPFMASYKSNYSKPTYISNRVGDLTGLGGRNDGLDPKIRNLSGLGFTVADGSEYNRTHDYLRSLEAETRKNANRLSDISAGGGGGWDKMKDPSIIFNPMNNSRFENGISGGIIGTLSEPSAGGRAF